MIEVQALAKQFSAGGGWPAGWPAGRVWGHPARPVPAVQAVSFVAPDACITGLLGANGAGKTTTLRMVAGLLVPDSGRIRVDGIDVVARPQAAQALLGVLSDARGLSPRLTARENITYYGRLHGLGAAAANARAVLLADVLDLRALLDRRTDGFSQGERMKTALARALVHDPSHIILDEPTNGLDVLATRSLRDALRRLRDEHGKCIVFSTHIMQEVERLCDRVVVVAAGRTVADGSVAGLLARTGQTDFEACFVQLAFPATTGATAGPAAADGSARHGAR